MKYVSTRGEARAVTFNEALIEGLARDGGLYVPESWPQLSQNEIAELRGKSYAEVALRVIAPFVGDDIPVRDLKRMIEEAYATFTHKDVTPLRRLASGEYILELFHGPTLAFKDVAMQLIARLMDYVLAARGERCTIVGATSGDTGGAATEAFRGRERIDLIFMFPQGRVSAVQERMMTAVAEPNVNVVAIDGNFDDCQAIVKALFNDHAFRDRVKLSAVNSINWARIVAQIVYYFTAAAALGAPEKKITFAVPTGNFGDVFAGYVAAKMGLPIERLIVATNVNDILARTLETGRYEVRGVVATSSPAMDIQVSSNFERLLFDACGRDPAVVRDAMRELTGKGSFALNTQTLATMRALFAGSRADEAQTRRTIAEVYAQSTYVLDPHTAVGVSVARKLGRATPESPLVVLGTAHPAKFPEAVEEACGVYPQLPQSFSDLMRRKARVTHLPNDAKAVSDFVLSHARAAKDAASA
ncbi:MAG TPA: threonine synthase [Xanthobacteraceae bacterium]|nr:threonine synthase [Xanthobacteraceae bacterium]